MRRVGMISTRCAYHAGRIVLAGVRHWSIALLFACSDAADVSSPPPPGLGTIRIDVTTTGADLDPDGYLFDLDNLGQPARLAVNGSTTFRARVGMHTMVLSDIQPNCVIETGGRTVSISAPGEEVVVDVRISCSALGHLRISVATTGTDIDATGYTVMVNSVTHPSGRTDIVQVNGSVVIPLLVAGPYIVALLDVAANCSGSDLASREVEVVSGDTVALALNVTCAMTSWLAYSVSEPGLQTDIYAIRSNGGAAKRLTTHPGVDEDPAWSPDGGSIAFTSNRDGRRGVFVMDEDGGGVTRLTDSASAAYRPDWSRDGSRIAFVSERDGNAEIYVMDRDGTNVQRLTNSPAPDSDPAWSPDGTRIAFASTRDGNPEIYVMNADGSGITRFTTNDSWDGHPAWAPDGVRLAFSRLQCDFYSCYPAVVIGAPGSALREVGVGEDPAWSPDGLKIAVTQLQCEYYSSSCEVAGIGMLSVVAPWGAGYFPTWEPVLTRGAHRNPTWRP